MLNSKSRVLLFAVLSSVLVLGGCYHHKTPEQRAEGIVNAMVKKLDLNDAQKAKLEAMKQEFLAKAPQMRKTREESFDQLIFLMRSPSIDQRTITSLTERNKAQADDLVAFVFSKFSELHDMLTPEQREKAAKEMERWREEYREHSMEGAAK